MKNKYKCLYEITGRIEDVATFLVPIGDLPKREMVGLTDEEAQKVFHSEHCNISADLAGILARAIEAKLKEKNT